MAATKGYFQSKTGENHGIFGYKYLKFHRMRDPKWAAGDKMIQYVGITKLYERDRKLQTLKTVLKRKGKQRHTQNVRKTLKENTGHLKIATFGDAQLIKTILQEHSEIQRAYHPLMIEQIVDKIDQRTFAKRKTLDQLQHQLKFLSDSYESELLAVAELQNRTKYKDPQEVFEETEAKSYELELRHCSTRIRTADAVNRAYNEIIRVMLKDSIYYDPVLSALNEDLIEQYRFIRKTIDTGLPVMKNIQSLQREFEKLDIKTTKELTDRFNTLMEHREILNNNNIKVKTLVRRDSDFDVNPSRYDRDTRSMVDLKIQMEDIQKILKQLKNATSCGRPQEIYPRVKQQVRDSEQMKKRLAKRELQRNLEQINTDVAGVHHDELANDFTPDELRRVTDYKALQDKIGKEREKQQALATKKKHTEDVLHMLKASFRHIADVLRNVDVKVHPQTFTKPNDGDSMLNLPLLNFSAVFRKLPTQQNIEIYSISSAKEKISHLMKIYSEAVNEPPAVAPAFEYKTNILKECNQFQMRSMKETGKSIMDDMIFDDPSVYNRKQIKQMSANIVEKNSKRED
ncbi:uncharacterized protein LOC119767364 [Culex quinquefasciatus]|uniref:uncharacterized protein LOC119767364 n=1 Tax=Culex quinquefasciatus TaxID=7176 RepID=UPI0018E39A50|nr:uncharacterized protein LOC119767364 [Culex quinquefasciatus]